MSISKIKARLSRYIDRAAYGRDGIVILSRGKPKAAMISKEDLERFEELEAALAAAEALEAFRAGQNVPWKQVRAQLVAGIGPK